MRRPAIADVSGKFREAQKRDENSTVAQDCHRRGIAGALTVLCHSALWYPRWG